MGLTAPLMLLGLLCVAAPIYLHLIKRQDQKRLSFPSLMFIKRVKYSERHQMTLRDLGLLVLRTIAIGLVCLAFALPFLTSISTAGKFSRDIVLLVDTSYSMAVADRFEQALRAARKHIRELDSDQRAALVVFDQTPQIVTGLTSSKQELLDALARLNPGQLGTHYPDAFEAATRLLAESPAEEQKVVLISDLQQSAVSTSQKLRLPADAIIEIERVMSDVPANLSLADARITNDIAADASIVSFNVHNTGAGDVSGANIEIFVDGRRTALDPLTLAAGESRMLQHSFIVSPDRAMGVEIALSGDDFAPDNTLWLVASKPRLVRLAVISAGATGEAYVREAVRLANDTVEIQNVELSSLASQSSLENFDVLLLNQIELGGPERDRVLDFAKRGGGVLEIANQKKVVTEKNGATINPGPVIHPLSFQSELSENGVLYRSRVYTWSSTAPEGETILALPGGSPLLTETASGAGRYLWLATGLDPSHSTLVLETGFVELMERLINYLGRRHPVQYHSFTGDPVDLSTYLDSMPGGGSWQQLLDNSGVVIELPSGSTRRSEPGENLFIPREPGIYEVHGTGSDRLRQPLAINVGRGESMFESATEDRITELVSRDPIAVATSEQTEAMSHDKPDTLAWYLLALAALLLMLECLVANRLTLKRLLESGGMPNHGG